MYFQRKNLQPKLGLFAVVFLFIQWGHTQIIDAEWEKSLAPQVTTFSLEDGLSQVTINDMVQDEYGFVWIATQEGLNRFDGQQFKIYRREDSLAHTLNSNYINKLLLDTKGGLWVGTLGGGLHYYESELEAFRTIPLNALKNQNINIEALAVDSKETIWVGTNLGGLHRLHGNIEKGFDQTAYGLGVTYTAIYCNQNQVWVGSDKGEIFVFDQDQKQIDLSRSLLQVDGQIRSFCQIQDKILIGTDTGLFIYDVTQKTQSLILLNDQGASPAKYINDLLLKEEHQVWIASGSGLFLYDFSKHQIIKEIEHRGNSNISNNTIQSLLALSAKKLLVGTANSLNLIDFSKPTFQNISKNQRGAHLLNDNIIFSIFRDQSDLWIGTSDGGLNLIRGHKVYYFQENKNDLRSITGNVVRGIKKDTLRQRLWLATTRGLSMIDLTTFDPEQPHFEVFRHDPNDPNSINHDLIKDICLDQNGDVWGATAGHGIFRLRLTEDGTSTVRRYKHDPQNKNSLVHDVAQGILEDQYGHIWIGTRGGLSRLILSKDSAQFKNFKHQKNDRSSLSHNNVYDLMLDAEDRLWLGTRKGLNLKLDNNLFASWTAQDQFPNDVVYSIQNDTKGNLWMGTNKGIIYFNPENESFRKYGVEDGIQNDEFDLHAKFLDEKGNVYLGGISGLTIFQPDDLLTIDQPRALYFSELRIKDQLVFPSKDNKNPLSKSIVETRNLKLTAHDFPFYLSFSIKDFRQYRDVQYVYRLQPGEKKWNHLEDQEIQFLNLASGDYVLQVNGKSRGKVWDQEPLEMQLELLPPWWYSNLALLSYGLLLILLIYGLYQFLLSRKIAQQETLRLQELDAFKTRFYANITHEFRTPLTVIRGMTDELYEKPSDKPKQKLSLIRRNSQSLLDLINQMLSLSKLQAGGLQLDLRQQDIIKYLGYLVESYESYARSQGNSLQFYSEKESLIMDMDEQKLERVLLNLIANAIKFTPEHGKILIVTKCLKIAGEQQLRIMVKDNGIGIKAADIPYIFDPYRQGEGQQSHYGTGLGLALVKELIELMNGRVEVQSEPGKDTRFYIYLPIRKDAPKAENSLYQKSTKLKKVQRTSEEITSTPLVNKESDQPILLLIEDNADVAFYIQNCLNASYEVIHQQDGKSGLEKAFELIPDIIISDVMMPEMDGFEVCKRLKRDERTNHIPIILLTAKASAEDKLVGLEYGADAYLTKPFEKRELLTRIEKLLDLRRTLQRKFSQSLIETEETLPIAESKDPFLVKVDALIMENLADENFSNIELARAIHLSRSQLYRKIKALTGVSTSLYIRKIRLLQARRLLSNHELSVSEVAYKVGFKSPVYFSQAFKDEFGESPSATRK